MAISARWSWSRRDFEKSYLWSQGQDCDPVDEIAIAAALYLSRGLAARFSKVTSVILMSGLRSRCGNRDRRGISIRDLKIKWRDGNETVLKQLTTLHVHHAFLYISLPFLHYYDEKMPNFVFYGERKQATTKFYFAFWTWIWSLGIHIQRGFVHLTK